MVNSMTAHGRSNLTTPWGSLTIEIQSVNRKHLEINTSLPRELQSLDVFLRKKVQQQIRRGMVQISLSMNISQDLEILKVNANLALASQLQSAWKKIIKKLKLDEDQSTLKTLLINESKLMTCELKTSFLKQVKQELGQVVDLGLEELSRMRQKEGAFLKVELSKLIGQVDKKLKSVQKRAQSASKERQDKLKNRLNELLEHPLEEDERLLREIALIADKSDISEELTRIASHLQLFKETLAKPTSIGKTLDFILQELNREWNTIASKCQDIEISQEVIAAKSECEKIREQVQNIE